MELFRVVNVERFGAATEAAMDTHFATQRNRGPHYIVVGCRVAILVTNPENFRPLGNYLDQPWLQRGIASGERVERFERWLSDLPPAPPDIEPTPVPPGLRPIPIGTLPPPLPRPASIYGHLPFTVQTDSQTLIYRWEAFPSSRRIKRNATGGGTVDVDTYASPASEVPFAVTGFAAVARFALPNLLPACFRWELQPTPCVLECGASGPLYGQSGGGVEVKFTATTPNRCPIADPVVLPAL